MIVFFYSEELVPFDKLKKWAETLVNNCVKDKIRLLELCSECFVNMSRDSVNWFTNLCGRRHEIVWAKPDEYFYWPAKVLRKEDDWITVQFFGTYEINNISCTNIIDYSDNNPNDAMAEEDIQRLKMYIEVGNNWSFISNFEQLNKYIFYYTTIAIGRGTI